MCDFAINCFSMCCASLGRIHVNDFIANDFMIIIEKELMVVTQYL